MAGAARRTVGSLLALLLVAVTPAAAADDSPQPPGTTQGPMTVERSRNGWVIAPDVEVGRVGHSTATHAGAYGGWMFDNTLLLGGAFYWQTNRSGPRTMDYGGGIAEWLAATDHRIGFGARALVGAGRASLATTITPIPIEGRDGRFVIASPSFAGLIPIDLPVPIRPTRFELRRDFVIFEPQAHMLVNLTQRLRIRVAGGYRVIDGVNGWSEQLRGATGSVGVEFGGTSSRRVTSSP